ncbi:hypothetical protein LEP1GSC204_0539 [Leptospira interrogans serovar Copenhageni str. M20]|nr:hypothetical protein LEP1GSC117_1117 [Leptospira interrogans serovar Icterohaemorrhagiae str. Verdun LP]EMY54248.1 hypothetical protein LEP1GSC204_0539 [Leptospira interrogans serovar Copenhageni str. M20]
MNINEAEDIKNVPNKVIAIKNPEGDCSLARYKPGMIVAKTREVTLGFSI